MRMISLIRRPLLVVLLGWLPQPALAHGLFDGHVTERAPLFITAVIVAVAWGLYILGSLRIRTRGSGAAWFHRAMQLVVCAGFGPIDDWAETSTSWHMT